MWHEWNAGNSPTTKGLQMFSNAWYTFIPFHVLLLKIYIVLFGEKCSPVFSRKRKARHIMNEPFWSILTCLGSSHSWSIASSIYSASDPGVIGLTCPSKVRKQNDGYTYREKHLIQRRWYAYILLLDASCRRNRTQKHGAAPWWSIWNDCETKILQHAASYINSNLNFTDSKSLKNML